MLPHRHARGAVLLGIPLLAAWAVLHGSAREPPVTGTLRVHAGTRARRQAFPRVRAHILSGRVPRQSLCPPRPGTPVQQVAALLYAGRGNRGRVRRRPDHALHLLGGHGHRVRVPDLGAPHDRILPYRDAVSRHPDRLGRAASRRRGAAAHRRPAADLRADDAGLARRHGLIFLAFGIKCAFPLLHNWLQDSYPAATVTGTVILSAFTTKLAVYGPRARLRRDRDTHLHRHHP